MIVPIARTSEIVAPLALLSVTVIVSLFSFNLSSVVRTLIVLRVSPAANLSVPLVDV